MSNFAAHESAGSAFDVGDVRRKLGRRQEFRAEAGRPYDSVVRSHYGSSGPALWPAYEGGAGTAAASGIVAIVRIPSPDGVMDACRALCRGGVGAVEITLTVPRALDLVGELVADVGDDLPVGAGTVLDLAECRRSVDAGAQFVVSSAFDVGVVEHCQRHGVLAVPGALTPTEATTRRS